MKHSFFRKLAVAFAAAILAVPAVMTPTASASSAFSLADIDRYVTDAKKTAPESTVSFNTLHAAALAGIGGTFKSGLALYNAVYDMPAENLTIDARALPELIRRFTSDRDLAQEDVVLLMRAVPDRLPTILPGLTIAHVVCQHFGAKTITYSDSGVREGYIYSEIIGK